MGIILVKFMNLQYKNQVDVGNLFNELKLHKSAEKGKTSRVIYLGGPRTCSIIARERNLSSSSLETRTDAVPDISQSIS